MAGLLRRIRWGRIALAFVVLLVVAAAFVLLLGHLAKGARPLVDEALLARPRPPPEPGHVHVTWTGVAGVVIEATTANADGTPHTDTLLVDPYVTRHSLTELAWPVDVDEDTVAKAYPRADAIVVGHSHHDHLTDAISVAKRTGAALHGSASTCAIAKGAGLDPAKCFVFKDEDVVKAGAIEAHVVEGEHGRSALGVPFPGSVEAVGAEPFVWQLKMGGAYAFVIQALGRRIYHQGSAGLTKKHLNRVAGTGPDLALIGIALRQGTPRFEELLLPALLAARIAPIHHDDFFGVKLTSDPKPLAGVDVPGWRDAVQIHAGAAEGVVLRPFEPFDLPAPKR